jgi:hypothetical protein
MLNEMQMFGMTKDEVISQYEDEAFEGIGHVYIMGILSDAQECILMGHNESARQFINKAKLLISHTQG